MKLICFNFQTEAENSNEEIRYFQFEDEVIGIF